MGGFNYNGEGATSSGLSSPSASDVANQFNSLFWTTASPYKSGRSDTKIQEGSIGTSCRHLLPGFNSGSVL